MKKYSFLSLLLLGSFLVMSLFSACDEEGFVAENIRDLVSEPEITEFIPASGSAGTEIIVRGNHLATVNAAFIGGVETKVENRISNNELLLKVIGKEVTGPIKLVNSVGEVESGATFTMAYVVPAISSITPEADAFEPRDVVVINGSNLKAVLGFYFGDAQAEVLSLSNTKAEIVVPFVEAEWARIRLQYYGAGAEAYVQSVKEYEMLKPVIEPVIISVPDEVEEGSTITITGENLDRISQVFFGELELVIESVTFSELVVLFPEGLLTADAVDQLTAIHNLTHSLVIHADFEATIIPLYPYYFWENIELSAQEGGSAFFSAKEGMTYDNCSAPSFVDDLDFSGYITNAKYFTIYGPHNTTNVLRNYKCGDTGLDESMGSYMAIETRFRILSEGDAAHNALIQKVKNAEIEDVNVALFEGISDPSSSTAANKFDLANPEMQVGSVIYFWNKVKDKRGILHVKALNVNYDELDKASTLTMDVYYER